MTISLMFRNTTIRAVYLISYIQRGNVTDTAFHGTYSYILAAVLDVIPCEFCAKVDFCSNGRVG